VVRKLISGTVLAALLAGTASADTLREALVAAYQSNPTLMAQRQALRATDATVAIARAAGRPQVSGTVGLNRDLTRSGILNTGGSKNNVSVGVDVSYPLFNGGSVRNQVKGAQTRVLAGRATLQAVEGDVFTNAVSAYMDVIRDRSIVELNQNNIKVLETNLQATQDRFQIGDVTRTDVAQSEARLQLGRSQLATAQGQLTSSDATYRQVIGHLGRAAGDCRGLRRPRCRCQPAAEPLGRGQRHLRQLSWQYRHEHRRRDLSEPQLGHTDHGWTERQHSDLPGRPPLGPDPRGAGSSGTVA
jgi:outer membrane protein